MGTSFDVEQETGAINACKQTRIAEAETLWNSYVQFPKMNFCETQWQQMNAWWIIANNCQL